ncbi:MAG: aldo/keto reductase [Clostridia bacterium]
MRNLKEPVYRRVQLLMEYNKLGRTNIKVSQVGFGALTLSKLQKNLSPKEARYLLDAAVDYGINFFDTSEFYDNYSSLSYLSNYENIVMASKSYAYNKSGARKSVEKALKELNRSYIDIFCLHEQESELTLKGHLEALLELKRMKEEGLIRAIGISTHYIRGAKAAIENDYIEIVQAIINYKGVGIVDGTLNEMDEVLKTLKDNNKGIYAMKILGGGSLYKEVIEAFTFIKNYPNMDSFALGIGDLSELEFAVKFFTEGTINKTLLKKTSDINRKLYISSWCIGCGKCVEKCSQEALSLAGGKVEVNTKRCILCGYCVGVCPELCIKIF